MKLGRVLTYLIIFSLLAPSVYALDIQNFLSVFEGLVEFLRNDYILFILVIAGTGTVFGLLVYFGLSKTPFGENTSINSALSVFLGLLASLPILYAVRNRDVAEFLHELFSGWYGLAVGLIMGIFVFMLVYWVVKGLFPDIGGGEE